MAAIVVAGLGVAAIAYAAPGSIVTWCHCQPARQAPHATGPAISAAARCSRPTNAWNQEIASAPLHPLSQQIINKIQSIGGKALHPDFGENQSYGIPFVVVPVDQPLVPITYDAYGSESDPGPFPIPLNAPVEAGSDAHVLVLQQQTCQLYELFAASRSGAGWVGGIGRQVGPHDRRPPADRLDQRRRRRVCRSCPVWFATTRSRPV